jgi:S-DNA-T family DNA segregation ATPase FtsK/SpoIIIE
MNLRRDAAPTAQPKRHEVAGLVLSALAALSAMALLSYDARGGADWAGPLGRRVAEVLTTALGTASLLIPWSLAVNAVRMFRRTTRPVAVGRVAGTLAIIATAATALHLWWGERAALGGLNAGGLLGSTLGDSLRASVGTAGAHTLVLTALLVALVARTRLSVVSVAVGARSASALGGLWLRNGVGSVARAWRESRHVARAPAAPPRERPEELAERAVRPVIDDDDDAPEEGDDPERDGRSLAEIMLDEEDRAASEAKPVRRPRSARRKPVEPEPEADAEVEEEAEEEPAPAPVRARAARSAPVKVSAPAKVTVAAVEEPTPAPVAPPRSTTPTPPARRASTPPRPPAAEPVADDDTLAVEDDEDPAAPLTIVSHAREIEQAMKSATVPVEKTVVKHVDAVAKPMAMPDVGMLAPPPPNRVSFDEGHLRATAERLVRTLADYTIEGRVMEIHPGPVVTTYEVVPAAGTKLTKISRLSDDIAMSLEASKVRIVAPIPGKGRVGFEIPNANRQMVYLRELLETEAFRSLGGALPVAIGKDVVGAPFYADLATMPHLIVAGATGQGKSVGLNVMLTSLLYKRGPEEVKMLMIDPKMVELNVYDGIPHMLLPVVTDMKKATLALRWVVDEMERRYSLFAQTGSRNITTYNEKVVKAVAEGKPLRGSDGPVRPKDTGTTTVAEGEGGELPPPRKLPYILCVVDEFADLIMVAGKDIEAAVARLAQKARAAGIHVILATQRPSVDVITGIIKANFPARIAFMVRQKLDSRVILDQQGAENLLGKGDMLILPPGSSDLKRVHCAFVHEDEVQAVTDHWRAQGKPNYDEDILKPRDEESEVDEAHESDIRVPPEKYEKAVQLVLSHRKCSVSFVQRYLGIGYNVAARIVDKMEREGIVGAPKGPGKEREVLG